MDYKDYLKPEVVSQLKNMEIRARLVVEGFITGLHKSPYHGFSVEFSEYRQYMEGDNLKNIDWKVYGKTDKFYVKEFEEETNLKAYILLDTSKSMNYKSDKKNISKLEYGKYLAASLAYLLIKQRDACGILTFSDKIEEYIPPRMSNSHLRFLLSTLQNINPEGKTTIGNTLHYLADMIKRRGLIILISDLLDDPENIAKGLKHFRHNKHEVILFHLIDDKEKDFDFKEEAIFRDMEDNKEVLVFPWKVREDYKKKLENDMAYLKKECNNYKIDFVELRTSDSFDLALFNYIKKRKNIF